MMRAGLVPHTSRKDLLARVLRHSSRVKRHDGAGGIGHCLDGLVEVAG